MARRGAATRGVKARRGDGLTESAITEAEQAARDAAVARARHDEVAA